MPKDIFRASVVLIFAGMFNYWHECSNKRQTPEMMYLCGFYIFFFSCIGHKEARFLLPIAPFLYLMAGQVSVKLAASYSRCFRLFLWLHIIIETVFFVYRFNFHDQYWDAMHYMINKGDMPVHSLYTLHRYETSYYSWLHQRGQAFPNEFPEVNRTKLYVVN